MEYKGKKLTVSVYGHPHGPCVGMVMTGLPAGVPVDMAALQAFLARRAPGQSSHTTARKEPDIPGFCGGLINGRTDGEPLRVEIRKDLPDLPHLIFIAGRDHDPVLHAFSSGRFRFGGRGPIN